MIRIKLKKRIKIFFLTCFISSAFSASPGPLFSVTTTGSNLQIRTTIPGRTYYNAGIYLDTPGSSLLNPGTDCIMLPNGYCKFTVSDTTPATIDITGPNAPLTINLGLNAYVPIEKMKATINGRFLYITQFFNPSWALKVLVCPLSSPTGEIGTCVPALTNSDVIQAVRIKINAAGTLAYFPQQAEFQVNVCSINQQSGLLTNCGVAVTSLSNHPWDITFNSSETYAYISSNYDGSVTRCSINANNGTLTNCAAFSTGAANANDIVLNPQNTLLYVGTEAGLNTCQVDPSTGDLYNCTNQATPSTEGLSALAINSAGNWLYEGVGYGTTNLGTMNHCTLINGNLTSCTQTGAGFGCVGTAPNQGNIVLNHNNTLTYISSTDLSTVTICSISPTGLLTPCHPSSAVAFPIRPTGMALL